MTSPGGAARRAAVAVVAVLAAVSPAAHAATTTTVSQVVTGARTARFTLARTTEVDWHVSSDHASVLYGVMLTRVGGTSYAVDLVPGTLGPEVRMGYDVEPGDRTALLLRRGTYDLTLFSRTAARLRATLSGAPARLRFQSRPLQVWDASSAETHPVWRHDFPMTLGGVPHGAFVYQHDAWTGDARSSQTACVAQAGPCTPSDADTVDQLTSGGGLPGEHGATSAQGFAAADLASGPNTVSVESVVAGVPAARAAVVLVVP